MASLEMHIEAIKSYRPKDGDVLLVRPAEGARFNCEEVGCIRQTLIEAVPEGVKVVVVDRDIDIVLIRNEDHWLPVETVE